MEKLDLWLLCSTLYSFKISSKISQIIILLCLTYYSSNFQKDICIIFTCEKCENLYDASSLQSIGIIAIKSQENRIIIDIILIHPDMTEL